MTFGVSLKRWSDVGMLSREIALLQTLQKLYGYESITLFTYSSEDNLIAKELERNRGLRLKIISPKKELKNKFDRFFYSFTKIIFLKSRSKKNILLTNQLKGSWSAIVYKIFHGGDLITRTGYTLSRFSLQKSGKGFKYFFILFYEILMQNISSRYVISSTSDAKYFKQFPFSRASKLVVAKNYVESAVSKQIQRDDEVLFVGRLTKQKNIINILDACIELNIKITVIGEGEFEEVVKQKSDRNNLINYRGPLPHKEVLREMQRCKYYIIASLYEGMPKTLLEALASKCLCIVTKISAVEEFNLIDKCEVIDGFSKEDIKKSLINSMSVDNETYHLKTENGQKFVSQHHSISSFIESVLAISND